MVERPRLSQILALWGAAREKPANDAHFVRDYDQHVKTLLREHPRDEAMSLAVGGEYDQKGSIEAQILKSCGLHDGHSIIDIGCGSGRLAKHLGLTFGNIGYLGTDVVQVLLDYAAEQCPAHFTFKLHQALSIPAPDSSADFVTAFSVFTHLYHQESYLYLEDAKRVLVPGGAMCFSFLEFSEHWEIFEQMLNFARTGSKLPHLNMFIERPAISAWAAHLGFTVECYNPGPYIGQTTVLLRKPA